MTEQDKEWLEKCKENWFDYTIMMGDDKIFVVDDRTDEVVHTFSEYGYEFAKSLLEYIGCDVDYV